MHRLAANILSCDIAILGGGLAGGLIARALAERRPEIDVRIVEAGGKLGGNHVWSFFDTDIEPEDRWLVEPMVSYKWDGYDVAFPKHTRKLGHGYNSIESERFDGVVRGGTNDRIIQGTVAEVHATGVTLTDGRPILAKAVIDARGPGDLGTLDLGWQKFVGRLLRVEGGHGVTQPMVMDATVEQIDGYRFVYLLPFSPELVFVEDTYYSDTPDLDVAAIGARIDAYAAAKGWRVAAVEREETGVLPVAVGGDFDAYWASTGHGVAKAGMRAGLFNPTTGYSLPDAVRLATLIAAAPDLSGAALEKLTREHARKMWRERSFYRLLNTMLFRAAHPHERNHVIARFYKLNAGLVTRFYAAKSTLSDKARILVGKPPIPISRVVRAIVRSRF